MLLIVELHKVGLICLVSGTLTLTVELSESLGGVESKVMAGFPLNDIPLPPTITPLKTTTCFYIEPSNLFIVILSYFPKIFYSYALAADFECLFYHFTCDPPPPPPTLESQTVLNISLTQFCTVI